MKKILLLSLGLVLTFAVSLAQERTVSGKITSAEDGASLPGVNVVLKGTTNGTITDVDGNYKLTLTEEGGTLIFSFVGLLTQEIDIGARSVIDVQLAPDISQLSEIVVTALGIERESRELGYSISGVKAEDLTVSRDANILEALQGKVTGVTITRSSGNLGASTKIIIRGVTSLSGANNPLWIVDGVPIDNQQTNSGQGNRISGNRDFANGAAVINPDDIASINILKGAAAAALYGSRAAAGVIVVTTKKGKTGRGGKATVTINSTVRFDKLFIEPDYQDLYAGGDFYKYDSSATGNNWGARIVGQTVSKAITGERVPLRAYDNLNDFYGTGKTIINNFAVGDANERGDYRLSITALNQDGILPGAELDRITASFNAGFKHSDKFNSRFGVTYVRTTSHGTGVQGANDPNIIGLTRFVRTTDFNDFLPWIDESGNQINTVGTEDNNPYWVQIENLNDREDDRFLGNFQLRYSPIDALTFTARLGYDFNVDERLLTNRNGTVQRATGDFLNDVIQRRQLNTDIIANYFTNINEDLEISVLGGFNFNRRVFERDIISAQSLSIPNLFSPPNAQVNSPTRDFTERKLFGAYGEVVLTYKNWASLNLTARNDWSSTLPLDNNSYFYPSASLALVFTDAFQISNDILSFGKLRASIAQVGNDTNPYQLAFTFTPRPFASGQYSLNVNFPIFGQLGFSKTNTIPPSALLPEEQTSVEFGTELGFLSGRIGLDVTYFNSENKNQILAVPIPQTTGFSSKLINTGTITTSGIEITLDADIFDTQSFKWNSIVNFSHARSIVDDLAPGVSRFIVASAFNSVQVIAEPGKQYQVFGFEWLKDSVSGRPIIDPETGLRQTGLAVTQGSVLPDFSMGFMNNFTFKGITLSVTVDYREGGKVSSSSSSALINGGFVDETLRNREGTFIDLIGVLENPDGSFRDNDIPVRSAKDFWQSLDDNSMGENKIYDATYVKLREIGLYYTFPDNLLANLPISGLQVGVEGRNIALLYTKVPHIDPEANLFGSGVDGFGIERASVPSTRSIGFNVKLSF